MAILNAKVELEKAKDVAILLLPPCCAHVVAFYCCDKKCIACPDWRLPFVPLGTGMHRALHVF